MNLKKRLGTGALLALAAGGLFAAACKKDEAPAPTKSSEKTAKVACTGVNECKGHGACKTAHNACAGQNGCGGQGVVELTAEECAERGGTVAKR